MRRPKKPLSPYMIFSQKFIKASDQPKATMADLAALSKQSGDTWNSLNAFEKQVNLLFLLCLTTS